MLARAIAGSIDGAVASRIQCTPDLQPTDITGLSIWNPPTRSFEFREGPVFANIVLVDEVNRALPKAQSALLEAMAERQVTVDGVTRSLPDPFLVLATENPIEQEGTFPLPEAQLDRFFLRTALGYPDAEDEVRILDAQRHEHPLTQLQPVLTVDRLHVLLLAVEEVFVDDLLKRWIVDLVRATRTDELVLLGASVRGSLALERAARAWALLHGRTYATADDVEALFLPVIGHRLLLSSSSCSTRTSRAKMRSGASSSRAWSERRGRSPPGTRPRARTTGEPSPEADSLVPRRRFAGEQFGRRRSSRRGDGDEIVGTRPYRPGDRIARIHWAASAQLSAARSSDEFLVREYFAEHAPQVAFVRDVAPGMAGNTAPSPWLDKEAALEAVLRLVAASAAVEHGELAYVDAGGRPRWLRPPDGVALTRVLEPRQARQPGALGDAVSSLVRSTTILPPGSFVFVASDFLTDVPSRIWPGLRALGLDVIPVVIQDPTWEQTFPRSAASSSRSRTL